MIPRALALCAVLVLAVGTRNASAGRLSDVDREAAKAHFEAGRQLYTDENWAGALAEFQAAAKLIASPALNYNIARCFDRLEQWAEAADLYEKFVKASPDDSAAPEVRERIIALRARLPPPDVMVIPKRKRPILEGAIGGGAVLFGAIGAGLLAHVSTDLSSKTDLCCHQSDADALHAQAYAGYAMLGIAGVLVVADAVLWGRWARKPKPYFVHSEQSK